MHFSPSSILSSLIASSIFICAMCIILKSDNLIKLIGRYVYLYSSIIIIRLVMPFEFNFTHTLLSTCILPTIQNILWNKFTVFLFSFYLYELLLFIWLSGSLFFLLSKLYAYFSLKNAILQNPECTDGRIYRIVNALLLQFSIKKEFKIISVPYYCTPAITGLKHPIIIVPEIILSDKELAYILQHEITHYYYKDIHIKALMEILSCIYWWNPLIQIFKKQVSNILEIHNDCATTSQMTKKEKLEYLECILKIAKINTHNKISSTLCFSTTDSCNLKQRFTCVLSDRATNKSIPYILCIILMPLILLYISFFVILEPHSVSESVAETTFELNPDTSYILQKNGTYYLYIDNVFIGSIEKISDEFKNLKIIKEGN